MAHPGNFAPFAKSPLIRRAMLFWHWWVGELIVLLPKRFRAATGREQLTVLVSIEQGRARFSGFRNETCESLLDIDLHGEVGDLRGSGLPEQLARKAGAGFRLVLTLPKASFLKRSLALPLAVEENLGQTLGFELDRYTPFRSDEAYFDFAINNRDVKNQTIEVILAVAKRRDVDPLVRIIKEMGLSLQGLAFAGELLSGHTAAELAEPNQLRTPGFRLEARVFLAMLFLVLAAALLALPIWQKRETAIALINPMTAAREAARKTDLMRDRLDQLVVEHNALHNKKWDTPSLVQVLDEITQRLKDDTYVLNLSLEGNTITLQGESSSGAELVAVLGASPLFRNVVFKSPLIKLQGGTHDRFIIGAEINPAGLPKPSVSLNTDSAQSQ